MSTLTTRLLGLLAVMLLGACAAPSHVSPTTDEPTVMRAVRTDAAVKIDGDLQEQAWQMTPAHPLSVSRADIADGVACVEGGTVRLLWDTDFLYVGVMLVDSDAVQDDDRDQQHHYITGDVIEVFLKPDGARHYWEFYATPNGRKTSFFYPGRGRLSLPSTLAYHGGLEAAAVVRGTLNDWRDVDQGWSAELAIPRRDLADAGVPLDADHRWRICIGRYNYSAYLSERELTMYPRLPVTAFHRYENWANLMLGQGTPQTSTVTEQIAPATPHR